MAIVRFTSKSDSNNVLSYLEENGVKGIIELSCSDGSLTDDDVESLGVFLSQHRRQVNLQVLKLPNNGLRSGLRAVAYIVQMAAPTLRELDLSNNLLGADGLTTLVEDALTADNCKLLKLNLNNNKLSTNQAAAPLASLFRNNNSIEELFLSNNSLGAKTVKNISEALSASVTLKKMDLSYNKLNDRGIKFLAKCLDPNRSRCYLRDLNLTYNKIGPIGISYITDAMVKNNSINTTLIRLDLSLNIVQPKGAEHLARILEYSYTLEELILSRNNILDEGCIAICQSLAESYKNNTSRLRILDLSWNSLTDTSAVVLADDLLLQNAVLEKLNLASNAITSVGICQLARAVPSDMALKELDIIGNQATDQSADALAEVMCRPRCKLEVKWEKNRFTFVGEERLRSVSAFRNHLKRWLNRELKNIEVCHRVNLDLRDKNLSDNELIALSHSLAKYGPMVPTTFLSGPKVTIRGIKALSEILADNSAKMIRLYISKCPSFGDTGAVVLAQALYTNTTLTVLSLTNCSLSENGIESLAIALSQNNVVSRLNLGDNHIGDGGLQKLLRAIIKSPNVCLTSLNVSNNNITDQGLRALTSTSSLKELFLARNAITDQGALDLAKACMGSKQLDWLDVSSNFISKKGIQALEIFHAYPRFLDSSNQKIN